MAQNLDIPLPELTTENFTRGWTRFELVGKAKEWDQAKQLTVLPTLLRGKLLDSFVDFDDDTKGDMKKLRGALMKVTGLEEDPLSAAKSFTARDQRSEENVADFASVIKKLFRRAYPEEPLTSKVLLQRFLTGLRSPISQQLLLQGRPEELNKAIEDAMEVEYALGFKRARGQQPVNAVSERRPEPTAPQLVPRPDDALQRLQTTLESITKRMEELESTFRTQTGVPRRDLYPVTAGTGQDSRSRRPLVCFHCKQEGHIKQNCPLNFGGLAGTEPIDRHLTTDAPPAPLIAFFV